MAKKKKQKEKKEENTGYKIELIGLALIIVSLVGIMQAGIVGIFVTNFAVFLVGTWYIFLFLALIATGSYMIAKRKLPDFLTTRMIGIYILVISILILSHVKYISSHDLKGFAGIITETVNMFMQQAGHRMEIASISNICGGMIGAFFAATFSSLLAIPGTIITTIALMLGSIVLITDISLADLFNKITSKIKMPRRREKEVEEIEEKDKTKEEIKDENEEKTVVLSLADLKKIASMKNVEEEIKEVEEEKIEPVFEEVPTKGYVLPPKTLLNEPPKKKSVESKETIDNNKKIIEQVLNDFNIVGEVIDYNVGPAVTQYEMRIKSGTKLSKIQSLNKEIALALAAKDVRIEAPIPGKSTIGIEIPNKVTSMVTVRELLDCVPKNYKQSKLLVTLGRNIMGKPVFMEINKTPHLLVAGSTGSGKSVCINSIIVSILMRTKPDEVKLVLVDPKKVELSMYECVPHLYTPVVTDAKKANTVLKNIVVEMEDRYEIFSRTGTKNIAGYNELVDKENQKRPSHDKMKKMPFIVVIIDELADLMLVAAKEVEDSIMRITQMARAAGIHLIVATQRPSTDVITGVVKANIPSRIAFAVSSQIDSRTILDSPGAEKLLGKGDMLFKMQGENIPTRVQGTFLSDDEIKKVANYAINQQKANYNEKLLEDQESKGATTMVDEQDATEEPLYDQIVDFVVSSQKASTSSLQRKFKIGFNRAARAMDLLEERGIVGPSLGSKPREVLKKKDDEDE